MRGVARGERAVLREWIASRRANEDDHACTVVLSAWQDVLSRRVHPYLCAGERAPFDAKEGPSVRWLPKMLGPPSPDRSGVAWGPFRLSSSSASTYRICSDSRCRRREDQCCWPSIPLNHFQPRPSTPRRHRQSVVFCLEVDDASGQNDPRRAMPPASSVLLRRLVTPATSPRGEGRLSRRVAGMA